MRRAERWAAGLVLIVLVSGCYRSVPLETSTPPIGQTVSFIISDVGRVRLADRLGPGVTRIEGRVVGVEPEEYQISVFRIAQIDGGVSQWTGETIRLDRGFVDRLQGRQLSKKRTWILAAGVTAGVALFIATRGLSGVFQGEDDPGDPTDPPDSRRVRPNGGY